MSTGRRGEGDVPGIGRTWASRSVRAPSPVGVTARRTREPAGGATFEWESVEGAAAYRVVVLDAEGRAVWAWEGSETAVALGGVPERPEGAEGPVLTRGSTWSVSALDGGGHVVAVSASRPASP